MTVLLGSSGVCWSADFQKGVDALERGDYATALKEMTPLAEQGNAGAQYNLGQMYRMGLGVLQDDKTALKWYTLAAEQGVAPAQYALGVMYLEGQGIPQDYVRSYMWFNLSAAAGAEIAVNGRDIVTKMMTPSQIEEAQKLARECVAKNYKRC